mmetsp:Transcript_11963/g.30270  ORF Transcript_11963/g.30270 Transcript_11963/m.30270 type:complete len:83 (-) Transcript_11963:104-352(-)
MRRVISIQTQPCPHLLHPLLRRQRIDGSPTVSSLLRSRKPYLSSHHCMGGSATLYELLQCLLNGEMKDHQIHVVLHFQDYVS